MAAPNKEYDLKLARLLARNGRYPREAYEFVQASVVRAVKATGHCRHITAREILLHLCELAVAEFGPMAAAVLAEWRLKYASDIGAIVFALIREQILCADEQDSPEDFNIDFDLTAAVSAATDSNNHSTDRIPIIE